MLATTKDACEEVLWEMIRMQIDQSGSVQLGSGEWSILAFDDIVERHCSMMDQFRVAGSLHIGP